MTVRDAPTPARRRARGAILVVLGAIAGALLVAIVAWAVFGSRIVGSGGGAGAVGHGTTTFAIQGEVTEPLIPGRSVPVDLRVTNDRDAALSVSGLRIVVTAVAAPRATASLPCTPADFIVGRAKGLTFTVGAHRTRSLSQLGVDPASWPRVAMRNTATNQNGCIDASLTLAYSATGKVATR